MRIELKDITTKSNEDGSFNVFDSNSNLIYANVTHVDDIDFSKLKRIKNKQNSEFESTDK